MSGRRAIAICRSGTDSRELDELEGRHDLEVVYTTFIDPGSPHAPRIALQYALDFGAEVVVVPELDAGQARKSRGWQALSAVADVVSRDGEIEIRLPALP